ncbi:universal stress protein [Leifsonia sp. PS1209]|uniref:universal stress protein n=1 Tax=Leifsonia sp. PS1209 TaxID=2724914 RepID=UPI001442B860|nr:universal stress protein [Leifsonia sp. PS1209]QIZ99503.1 universal stress protein [Leifsonia sp. PS1209]
MEAQDGGGRERVPSGGRIVVGFDGTSSAWRALDWAAARAVERGAALDVVHAVDTRLGAAVFGPRFDIITTAEEELAEARGHVHALAPTVPAVFRSLEGPPSAALLAASTGARLLVVGTDKRAGDDGSRIGSLPGRLASRAECTVAVIPDRAPVERNVVVVGLDGSVESLSAVAFAVEEAGWLHARIDAVHAWDVPEVFQRALDAGRPVDPEYLARVERVIPDALAQVTGARGAAITPVVVRDNPAKALIERATGAAALVVGTRGRGRLLAGMLGSVSHDVLQKLPCPVFVCPQPYDIGRSPTTADEREGEG